MLIIGLNGSPNRQGNTAFLLDYALKSAAELGAETETVFVQEILDKDKRPFCIACETPCRGACYEGTELENVLERLAAADGLLVASPVYFGNVSAQLKSFWDKTRRLRRDKKLFNTVGGGLTSGASRFGGQETTLRAMHSMMLIQGMILIGDSHEKSPGHHGACAFQPAEDDSNARKRAALMGKRMVEVCQATASLRKNR
ncbi:MAG: flavodoxin family protein [Dethiobacter sp.]|jgi:multimeric flavodoxin WrbA|nr:MAG: flavodoxin family protein [Dethiobacter sp.]